MLFAEEDTGGAFVIRAFFNFPETLPVAGVLASYGPTTVLGVQIPTNLTNLLVDPSRTYSVANAARIDSVGIGPGSPLAALTAIGGGLGTPFGMVQDSLNLYVNWRPPGGDGQIVRVTKTTGSRTVIATSAPNADGPIAGAIGIQPQGSKLYFAAFRNLSFNTGFVGAFMSDLPTQGSVSAQNSGITNYGITPPVGALLAKSNVSPNSIAVDFTNVYWLEEWDNTLRQMPLVGSENSTVLAANLPDGANFLRAPTHGAAGTNLFWIEGTSPNRRLMRRIAGSNGVIAAVVGNVASTNYAIAGDRIYFVSGIMGQANGQLCSVALDGGPIRALLPVADTGTLGAGEIATDGNAVYWVSTDINLTTRIKRLVLPVTGTPLIDQQPVAQNVAPGANVQFVAQASSGGLSQVWFKNGQSLVPATGAAAGVTDGEPPRAASVVTASASTSTLTLTNVTAADMGFYSSVITNSAGRTETVVAALTVETGGPSRLINLSTRGQVQAGAALTPGFVMKGSGSKQLLIRAVGPTLSVFGLAALSDTKMEVFNQQTSTQVAANDDWNAALTGTFSSLGAFALTPNSSDAATLSTLPVNQGGYTVRITASGAATSGLALAEVYDADPISAGAKLANVATLGFAGTGADALTPGFVIGGTAPKQVLIRAIGPGLAAFGVGGTLADPRLLLIPLGMNLTAAANDDWGGTAELKAAFAAAGAFSVPDGTKDAAIVVRLPPGGYTVVVSGAGTTTGNVLVEVYDLDP